MSVHPRQIAIKNSDHQFFVGGDDVSESLYTSSPWKRTKNDYQGGSNIIYRGRHKTYNAATNDPNWEITKFTYDVGDNLTDVQIKTEAYSDRGSISW